MQESDGNITQAEIAQVLYEAGHGYGKAQTAKIVREMCFSGVPRFDFYMNLGTSQGHYVIQLFLWELCRNMNLWEKTNSN